MSPKFWLGGFYLQWMSYQQKVSSFSKSASIRVQEGSPDAAVCCFAADRSVESLTQGLNSALMTCYILLGCCLPVIIVYIQVCGTSSFRTICDWVCSSYLSQIHLPCSKLLFLCICELEPNAAAC